MNFFLEAHFATPQGPDRFDPVRCWPQTVNSFLPARIALLHGPGRSDPVGRRPQATT
jgi:hypothetical protein